MTRTIRQSKEIATLVQEIMKSYPIITKQSEVFQFSYNLMATDIISSTQIRWDSLTSYSLPDQFNKQFSETRAVTIHDEDYEKVIECYSQRPNVHRVPFPYLTKLVLTYAHLKQNCNVQFEMTTQGELMMWVGSLFEEITPKNKSMIATISKLKKDYEEENTYES